MKDEIRENLKKKIQQLGFYLYQSADELIDQCENNFDLFPVNYKIDLMARLSGSDVEDVQICLEELTPAYKYGTGCMRIYE